MKKVIAVIKRRVTSALVSTPEAVEEVEAPDTVVEKVEASEAHEIQYI